MSIRSFVTVCSLLLMGWLALAFVQSPRLRQEATGASLDRQLPEMEDSVAMEDLAVSVSP